MNAYPELPHFLQQLLERIDAVERALVLAAFATLVLAIFIDVGARELTGRGIAPARELAVFAMAAAALIGIDLATRDDRHLRPRFADAWLPAHWQTALPRLTNALGAVILFGLAVLGSLVVCDTVELAERSPVLRLPIAAVQVLMPLVFGLSAFRLALRAIWPGTVGQPPA